MQGRHARKSREDRRTVVLQARMRTDRSWGDACILNLSSRGLLVYAPAAGATPGTFVEISRGEQAIVARVVWRHHNRMGLQCQGPMHVGRMIAGAGPAALLQTAGSISQADRRRWPRETRDSRDKSRRFEFMVAAGFGAVLAGVACSMVIHGLSATIAQVAERL